MRNPLPRVYGERRASGRCRARIRGSLLVAPSAGSSAVWRQPVDRPGALKTPGLPRLYSRACTRDHEVIAAGRRPERRIRRATMPSSSLLHREPPSQAWSGAGYYRSPLARGFSSRSRHRRVGAGPVTLWLDTLSRDRMRRLISRVTDRPVLPATARSLRGRCEVAPFLSPVAHTRSRRPYGFPRRPRRRRTRRICRPGPERSRCGRRPQEAVRQYSTFGAKTGCRRCRTSCRSLRRPAARSAPPASL